MQIVLPLNDWRAAQQEDLTLKQDLTFETRGLLNSMGVKPDLLDSGPLAVISPITGEIIASLQVSTDLEVDEAIRAAHQAYLTWRLVPAPRRGEFVRLIGMTLRRHKDSLGKLVSIEVGKVLSEGLGEVQEMLVELAG